QIRLSCPSGMIVQAGLDAVCSTLQRPLRAGDLLQPAGARCAPFAAGAMLLQMNREVLSFCRSSAPAAKGPHYKKPSPPPLCCRSSAPLRKGGTTKAEHLSAPLQEQRLAAKDPHTISTPETTNPPCRRVCHIKGSALQLRTGLDDGFGHIELLEVLDEQAGQ